MAKGDRFWRMEEKKAALKKADADGSVADSMEVRMALVRRMEAGEITLEQMQAEECARWFAYLDRQRTKSLEIQKIAAARRSGEIDEHEGQRRLRAIDNCSVTVYDGARLEQAVKLLLKNVK